MIQAAAASWIGVSRSIVPVRCEVAAAGCTDDQPRVPNIAFPFITYPFGFFQGEWLVTVFRPPVTEVPVS